MSALRPNTSINQGLTSNISPVKAVNLYSGASNTNEKVNQTISFDDVDHKRNKIEKLMTLQSNRDESNSKVKIKLIRPDSARQSN